MVEEIPPCVPLHSHFGCFLFSLSLSLVQSFIVHALFVLALVIQGDISEAVYFDQVVEFSHDDALECFGEPFFEGHRDARSPRFIPLMWSSS